jgi:hypothetical protein
MSRFQFIAGLFMGKLSDFLDNAASEPSEVSESLDQIITSKILTFSDGELDALVERLQTDPLIGPRFQVSLSQVKAVALGQHENQPMELELEAESTGANVKRSKIANGFHGRKWTELARFTPLRLSDEERRTLAIIDRSLKVSEYTDNVDLYISKGARQETIRKELQKIKAVLSGQYVAMKMSKTTEVLTDEWFQNAFEIARRYKAMNPDRMRETYVKLMYMLQDSRSQGDFSEWSQAPIKTVATELERLGIDRADFFGDPSIDDYVYNNSKTARESVLTKFSDNRDNIDRILNSVRDYMSLVNSFLDPLSELLGYLTGFFDPKNDRIDGFNQRLTSLSIRSGENGSRLTHTHSRQFAYVYQSLRLWREVLMYFMPIWFKAEEDLLSSNYRLADTGQGLNRVQGAPNCSRLMHSILDKVQRDLEGSWIGSSVVHMGDHTVPNALMFLDKYCQIPRILGPVAHTLKQLPKEYANAPATVQQYIDETFGSVENAQRLICVDFFKHAFDGSGADNAYDAGSCIDGRLTSSWNWCSKVEKKPYFPLFLLTNFVGFDGQHGWS